MEGLLLKKFIFSLKYILVTEQVSHKVTWYVGQCNRFYDYAVHGTGCELKLCQFLKKGI